MLVIHVDHTFPHSILSNYNQIILFKKCYIQYKKKHFIKYFMRAMILFIKSRETEKIALAMFFFSGFPLERRKFRKSRTSGQQLQKKIRETNSYQLH